jgi:uncharacterized protein YdaU (DUF1376 family)
MSGGPKLPWFKFYVEAFLLDTRTMTAEQVGAYVRLLCEQWREGSIPRSTRELAALAGIDTVRFRVEVWKRLRLLFEPDRGGGLVNRRLEEVRSAQDRRRVARSKAGKKAVQARWAKARRKNDLDTGVIRSLSDRYTEGGEG